MRFFIEVNTSTPFFYSFKGIRPLSYSNLTTGRNKSRLYQSSKSRNSGILIIVYGLFYFRIRSRSYLYIFSALFKRLWIIWLNNYVVQDLLIVIVKFIRYSHALFGVHRSQRPLPNKTIGIIASILFGNILKEHLSSDRLD